MATPETILSEDCNNVTLNVGDVEIGAVEIKNATTDDRARVDTSGSLQVNFGTVGTPDHDDDVTVDGTVGGVTLKAANANRKAILIQNTGSATIRVTVDGSAPTATHGLQLVAGAVLRLEMPYCPVLVVLAIREGGSSSTASVLEIT